MNALAALASNRSRQAAATLVEAVTGGDGIVSFEDAAVSGRTAVLDRAAAELTGSRVRVLRAAAPASGRLGLPELVAQFAGQADPGVLSDGDVERAFQALTEPDEGCECIALLVDDAECLQHSALRYIQLTCRSVPELRVVLAGEPGFPDMLNGDEFTWLRQRLTGVLHRPAHADERTTSAEAPLPCPAAAETGPAPPHVAARRPVELWVFVVLAMLASLCLGVWAAHQDGPAASAATAVEG
ncbi:MAG: hypothetical protein ACR2NB_13645 [Solirubrobacteraceae bacterium]